MADDDSQRPSNDTFSRFPPFNNALSEDEEVVKKFVNTIQAKIDNGILTSLNEIEKKMLTNAIFYPGVFLGSFVGLASFFTLRRAPLFVLNKMLARQHANSPIKINKNRPPSFTPYQEGTTVRTIGTVFDATVSFACGIITWALAIDKKKTLPAAADIPLVEGQSKISDALCGDFIHLYRNTIPPKFWTEYSDDTLTTITRFVTNCEKRYLYERRLRREMGLSSDVKLSLPSRVPENILEEEKERYGGADWAALEDFDEEIE